MGVNFQARRRSTGSFRNRNAQLFAQFSRSKGADIPMRAD